nr:PREDICTED: uncharacterized protein LOC109039659 [Bemisia tabaci]
MLQLGSVLCQLFVQLLAFGYFVSQGDGRSVHDASSGKVEEPAAEGTGAKLRDTIATEQRFFPSFSPIFSSPPLGHSRPQAFHQEPTFRQPEYTLRDLPFAYSASASAAETDNNVLGSGNFGVIRGGTYYTEDRDREREEAEYSVDQDLFPFYSGNNGHGRPSLYSSNPPANFRHGPPNSGADFFANFRDFADITAPTKSSYSEYYVVYVNQNSTKDESSHAPLLPPGAAVPKNIIEQLNTMDETPTKVSKVKQKLFAHQQQEAKKDQANKSKLHRPPKETNEPLLALS